jgi:hypothetical protein
MLSRYNNLFRDLFGAVLLLYFALQIPASVAVSVAATATQSSRQGAGSIAVCGDLSLACSAGNAGQRWTPHPACLSSHIAVPQNPPICRPLKLYEALHPHATPPIRVVDLNYELEINKTQRTLVLKNRDKVEKKYLIATGRGGPGDKRVINDKKTPVGTYRIVKVKEQSAFYSFLQLNYPNVKDAFFGLKNNIINRAEFDRIVSAVKHQAIPPQNTRLGGAIGIHGIGRVTSYKLNLHNNLDWTKGCIALTNEELDEIMRHVGVGTKVVINE